MEKCVHDYKTQIIQNNPKVQHNIICFHALSRFYKFINNIIQILTGKVMKSHVSVDCQESYIFPRDYIFPKCAALRENIVPREI